MTAPKVSRTEWYVQRGIPIGTLLAVLVIGYGGLKTFWDYDTRLVALNERLARIEARLPNTFPPEQIRDRLVKLESGQEHIKDAQDEIKDLLREHERATEKHNGGGR